MLLSLPAFLSAMTLASSSVQCHSHASLGCSGILVQPDDVENIQRIAVGKEEPSSSSFTDFLPFVSLDIAPPLCRFQAIDFLILDGKLPMVRLFDDRNLDYLSELKIKYGRNSELEVLVKSLVQVGAIVVVPLPLFSIPLMDLVSPFVHRKTFVSLTKVYRFILKEEDLQFIIDESFELETRDSRKVGLLRKELQENPLPRQLTSAVSPT